MTIILSVIVFVLLIVVLEIKSREHVLDGLKYDVEVRPTVVEPREVFELRSTVSNKKWIPVLFLKLVEYVPITMVFDEEEIRGMFTSQSVFQKDNTTLHQNMYIMGHQKVKRTMHVSMPKRGRYLLRGARMTAGDLLGIHEESEHIDMIREIVVKPDPIDIGSIERSFGGYLGNISVQRFINPDPIETVGFREYTGREPQKDISWKQSLRMNRLMVKQYDYTADERSSVIVNVTGGTEDEIEACFSLARSVCEFLDKKKIVYGFYTNATRVSSNMFMDAYTPDGIGKVHLDSILEQLGRCDYSSWCDPGNLLKLAIANHSDTRSYVLITPHPEEIQGVVRSFESLIGRQIFTINASFYHKEETADDTDD